MFRKGHVGRIGVKGTCISEVTVCVSVMCRGNIP